jgi:hypothetical protein
VSAAIHPSQKLSSALPVQAAEMKPQTALLLLVINTLCCKLSGIYCSLLATMHFWVFISLLLGHFLFQSLKTYKNLKTCGLNYSVVNLTTKKGL